MGAEIQGGASRGKGEGVTTGIALARAVVVAVLLGAVVGVAPVAAAPLFTVTGSGATMADVRIDHSLTLDFRSVTITGSGRYAGVEIWKSGSYVGGVLTSRDMDGQYRPLTLAATNGGGGALAPTRMSAPTATLRPGTYQVYLMADADARITVTLSDRAADGVTVRTSTPFKRTYSVARAVRTAADTSAMARVPLTLAPKTWHAVYTTFTPRVAGAAPGEAPYLRLTVCITRRGGSCARGDRMTAIGSAPLSASPSILGIGGPGGKYPYRAADARAEASFQSDFDSVLTVVAISHEVR